MTLERSHFTQLVVCEGVESAHVDGHFLVFVVSIGEDGGIVLDVYQSILPVSDSCIQAILCFAYIGCAINPAGQL